MFELYLIADGQDVDGLAGRVEQALTHAPAGRVGVQLRCKQWPGAQRLALAHRLRHMTRARGVPLLINGDARLAAAVGADGVHLPEGAGSPAQVRHLLGASALVGVSCHDRQALLAAGAALADFATLSPVANVPGKGPALGLAGFTAHAARAPLPVFALGGIRAADVGAVLRAGASGVAMIRAVLAAPAPAAALTEFLAAVNAHRRARKA